MSKGVKLYISISCPFTPSPVGIHLAAPAFPNGVLSEFFIPVLWHSGGAKYLKDYQILIMRLILVHFNLKSKSMLGCIGGRQKWHCEIKGPCPLAGWIGLTLNRSGRDSPWGTFVLLFYQSASIFQESTAPSCLILYCSGGSSLKLGRINSATT